MTSRHHPPAVIHRRQQQDLAAFAPAVQGLTDRQSRILLLAGSFIARHVPRDFQTLYDDDIADAADTVAATLETARRGVIYEHRARTPAAQHLADELKRALAELGHEAAAGRRGSEESPVASLAVAEGAIMADAIIVLRRLEEGAREMTGKLNAGSTAYRELLVRLLNTDGSPQPATAERGSGSLIIP